MKKLIFHLVFSLSLLSALAAQAEILIGMEYVLIERPGRVQKLAKMLGQIGAPMAKHYPEHLEWSQMQKGPFQPIDFSRSDGFVKTFQDNGFTDLILCLRSRSPWASRQYNRFNQSNPVPKPEHMDAYAKWIGAVVERYDGDGQNDMPGLKSPVRYLEIGSEFSSYEPEPPSEYLEMLDVAYKAAHEASPNVLVAHAAFLTTDMFKDNPTPSEYEAASKKTGKWLREEHPLEDIRQILDHPESFDLINVHALGDPVRDIEGMTKWLDYEMDKRRYNKPKIISDTITTPFIGWGPATICKGPKKQMGEIIYPAREEDRCRIAEYFQKVVRGDKKTVEWLQGYAGVDNVKKIVVADEQGYVLINTNFVEDLVWFKLPIFRAGTGNSAWAGLVDPDKNEYRAGFYALQQITRFLKGSSRLKRLVLNDDKIRVYEVNGGGKQRWVAWYEPDHVVLPGDEIPQTTLQLSTGSDAQVEEIITRFGQKEPTIQTVKSEGGVITLTLTPTPVLIQ